MRFIHSCSVMVRVVFSVIAGKPVCKDGTFVFDFTEPYFEDDGVYYWNSDERNEGCCDFVHDEFSFRKQLFTACFAIREILSHAVYFLHQISGHLLSQQ